MTLAIDTEKLVAVYAFGEWHKIKKGSVDIDAYQLMHYQASPEARKRCEADGRGDCIDWYEMGVLYEKTEPKFQCSRINEGKNERIQLCRTPSGMDGFTFLTPKGTRKAFSILECKAFEYEED